MSAGQPPHKFVATPTINATMLSLKQSCSNSQHPDWNPAEVETGVEQFALGNSALGDLKFASTLVESISIPRLSAG